MLCDVCHKIQATVHLTEVVNDQVVEMHICQACAQTKTEELPGQFNLSDFLGGLAGMDEVNFSKRLLKCPACGFSYEEFKKKGRLGCSRCYLTFKQQLLPLLKKIHRSVRHVGKSPKRSAKKSGPVGAIHELPLQRLRERLNQAIKLEEYEEAARLRDEIKKLETKNKE